MLLNKTLNNNFYDLNIFFSALIIVIFKWSISILTFENETLISKILFDIEDFYYLLIFCNNNYQFAFSF